MVKRVCGGIFLALWGRFGAKKGLGAIFHESSYAVTWGSLRMRSRPPPPMKENSSLGAFSIGDIF